MVVCDSVLMLLGVSITSFLVVLAALEGVEREGGLEEVLGGDPPVA